MRVLLLVLVLAGCSSQWRPIDATWEVYADMQSRPAVRCYRPILLKQPVVCDLVILGP